MNELTTIKMKTFEPVLYTKVYGERNSGTNYLEQLIKKNFLTELLRGGMEEIWHLAPKLLTEVPEEKREIDLNRIYDADAERILNSDFGWKHAAPPLETIASSKIERYTLFIIIVKHPYFWIRSLHANPYYPGKTHTSLREFAHQKMKVHPRDGIPTESELTPAEIFSKKLKGYFELFHSRSNTFLLRYEDLLSDFHASLNRIAHVLPKSHEKTYSNINYSTKKSVVRLTLSEYRRKYALENAANALDEASKSAVKNAIPSELIDWLGYQL